MSADKSITSQNWVGDTVITVAEPMNASLKLSSEARERLLDTCLVGDSSPSGGMIEDDWLRLEEALTEILLPVRYVAGRPSRVDTQANEHLTPLPLDQQVPGAWNFVEPR